VPRELLGNLGDHAKLRDRESTPVDADAEHEVLVFKLVRLKDRGAAAVDPRATLGVEAPPAETSPQVRGIDRSKSLFGVNVLDAGANIERIVVPLDALVGVERLAVPERPLPLATTACWAGRRAVDRHLGVLRIGFDETEKNDRTSALARASHAESATTVSADGRRG